MESEWKMNKIETKNYGKLDHEERVQQQEANTRLQSEQIEQLNKINMAMLQQQQQTQALFAYCKNLQRNK